VTLLGESAGGSSVSFHFLSPLAKGLFHRGIAVSGVDFSPFATTPKTAVLDASKQLAKNLDCTTKSNVEMLQCLRLFPSSTISKNAPNLPITPFVDNHFLPDEPKRLRKEGKFHKLPLMSGFVSQEGSFMLQNIKLERLNSSRFRDYLDGFLQREYKREKDQARIAFNALQFQYTPWADVNDSHRIRKKLVDMLTDYFIVAPTHAVLTMHSSQGAPTYMFEFSHRSKFHPKPKWMGVVHEDTSPYKFGLPLLNSPTKRKFDDDDKNVSDLMVTLFLNFAKFGDPTPTPVHGARWDPFNSSTKAYLKINKNPVMKNKYHPLRMAFWNSYFPTLIPARSLPPSSGESKTSGAILVRGTSLVFAWCMVTVGRLLRCDW
jgi:carboxylesterase type B